MKSSMEHLFVSGDEDGKGAVRTALESVHAELVQPRVEDAVFKEAIELVDAVTEVHKDNYEVKTAAGELLKQLVIAQGIPHETVSQEGFGSLLSKVKNALTGRDKHGVKATDRKPGQHLGDNKWWTKEGKEAITQLRAALDKYYLNDNWLNGQEFVTGTVKADDFSVQLEIDGKVGNDPLKNPDVAIKRIESFVHKWQPLVMELDKQVQAIQERMDKLPDQAKDDEAAAVAEVWKAIKEFTTLPDPLDKLPKFEGTSLGNRIPSVGKSRSTKVLSVVEKPKPKGVSELPALTKEQVKEAANLIKRIYSTSESFMPEFSGRGPYWLDHSDGSDFNHWIYDADNDAYMDYYDLFYHQGADEVWVYGYYDLIDEHALAVALEKWIDRSIK